MKRVVLITGVSGGIGRATAHLFFESGWNVIGVDRTKGGDSDEIYHFIQTDISHPEAPKQIIDEVTAAEGRIDALINNAAIQICKPLVGTSLSEWDQTMASNVRSVYLLALASNLPLAESKGSIVNVSSVHAFATSSGMAAYAASKGALVSLTRSMAIEFAQDDIRVNAILPGAVDTKMLHDGLSRGQTQGASMADQVRSLGKKHILGRVGRPEEVGKAILFLADNNQSSFITGQTLIVDGGATARLSTE